MAFTGGEGGGGGGSQAAGQYRSLRSRQSSSAMGEINVTPLVDVVLVLLLVFMVTAPMMTRSIDVKLPVADLPELPEDVRVSVTVNARGKIYVEDRLVPSVAALEDHLRALGGGKSPRVVYLRGDESLKYGLVIDVAEAIRKAGAEEVGFAYVSEQEAKAR